MHTLSFANDRFNKKYFQLEESRPCKDVDSYQCNDHMTSLCELQPLWSSVTLVPSYLDCYLMTVVNKISDPGPPMLR